MSNPSVFITGGTGFIGTHLVNELVTLGYSVAVLQRSTTPKTIPNRPAPPSTVKRIIGDILRPESYQQAMMGYDAVIHLAADYRVGLPPSRQAHQSMYQTNVVGTQRVLDAAEKAGIPHIVYMSTTAAFGETFGELPDENHRHNGTFRCYYEETKHIAHEQVVKRQHAGLPVNIAICSGVFGAGDNSVLAQTMDAYFNNKVPFQLATTSTFQLCHVSHICDGLIKLLDPKIQRQTYLFTGETFSMPEIFQLLSQIAQRKPLPEKRVSSFKLLAWLMDKLASMGLQMPLSQEALRILDGSSYTYSSVKAQQELGWHAGDTHNELIEAITQRKNSVNQTTKGMQ